MLRRNGMEICAKTLFKLSMGSKEGGQPLDHWEMMQTNSSQFMGT